MRIRQHNSRTPVATAHLGRVSHKGVAQRHVPTIHLEYLSPFACQSDPRGRTKWYGVYTEEQYQAQRQSEERARWAAGVRTLTDNQSQVAWDTSPLDPPALLAGVALVIISPRKPVSVGTVARACGSFECEDLRIVMPRQDSYITRHAKSASKGAQYILFRAGHYDSIEEATADCDVRIAFTRWTQASSLHVYKVDINGLTSHPAVQRVITQPLQLRNEAAAARGDAAAAPPRPPSAPWSEASAAAAEAGDALLAKTEAAGPAVAAPKSPSRNRTVDEENGADGAAQIHHHYYQQQWEATTRAEGFTGGERGSPPFLEPQLRQDGGPEEPDSETASMCASLGHIEDDSDDSSVSGNSGSSSSSSSGRTTPASRAVVAVADRPTGRPPRIALVFGREELGMSDNEVDSCEVCCSIPIGRLQESLSLSHAVSIALCALYQARLQHLSTSAAEPTTAVAAATNWKARERQARPRQPHLAPASTDEPAGALAAAAAAAAAVSVAEGAHARASYTVDPSTGAVRVAAALA